MVRCLSIVAILLTSTAAFAQEPAPKRPPLMIPLYATQLALQGADLHSTMMAIDAGHRENNPMLRHLTIGQMAGVKIAASSAMIVASEILWRRNRVAAVATMVAANAAMSIVAARNYRIARR